MYDPTNQPMRNIYQPPFTGRPDNLRSVYSQDLIGEAMAEVSDPVARAKELKAREKVESLEKLEEKSRKRKRR